MRLLLSTSLGVFAALAGARDQEGGGPPTAGQVREVPPHHPVAIAPYLLHLAPTRAVVCWVTPEPVVGELTLFALGEPTRHSEESPTRFHRLRLDGLVPGRDHRYHVGDLYRGTFRTPREEDPLRLAVFGHTAGTQVPNHYPVEVLAARLDDLDPDLILCTGDICYFTSYADFARNFFEKFDRFLTRKPVYVAAGNHDAGFPSAYKGYERFRNLFPYEFGSQDDAYYSFVRGNVRFVALSYVPLAAAGFETQLRWVRRELEGSTQEFNVVFLGGGNQPVFYDEDALFRTLGECGVDLVLGGDGAGVFQTKRNGVDFFFAGTNGSRPPLFYLLNVDRYTMRVQLFDAASSQPKGVWFFPTRREKRTVVDLTERGTADGKMPNRVFYRRLERPSDGFDGLRLVARNPRDKPVDLWLGWADRETPKAGTGHFFRQQALRLRPQEDATLLIPLPRLNPVTHEPYVLDEIYLQVDPKPAEGPYALLPDIIELSLIADR